MNKGKTFVKVWKKIDVCFEGATLWVQDGLEQEFRNQSWWIKNNDDRVGWL